MRRVSCGMAVRLAVRPHQLLPCQSSRTEATGSTPLGVKVESTVGNAKAFLKVQEEFGSFDKYIWRFVDGKPVQNRFKSMKELPANTPVSDTMSKELKKRGFRFVGSTICYALMQSIGMVNDHTIDCHRFKELNRN